MAATRTRKRRRYTYFNPLRLLGWLLAMGTVGIVLATIAVFFLIQYYSQDLPDEVALRDYTFPVMTRVHAADGALMAEYAVEKRVFVPIDSIPPRVYNAFVAAEDKRFWEHDGLDYQGIGRAVISNAEVLMGRGSGGLQGASTITQQVAKNFLLTNERSLDRKIKEALLALRIEQAFSDDKRTNKLRILELYLNEIYLGRRSYGVAAAALNYFDRSLEDLSIAEIAYLAALPKGPENYQVDEGEVEYRRAKARRNYVLDRMLEDGYITQQQHDEAHASEIELRRRTTQSLVRAGFFTEEVRRVLLRDFGRDGVYGGGLSVRTTLDPQLQRIAHKTLRDGLVDFDRQRRGWQGPVAQIQTGAGWNERLNEIDDPEGAEDWRLAMVYQLGDGGAYIAFKDKTLAFIPSEHFRWAGRNPLSEGDVILAERLPRDGISSEGADSNDVFARARRFPHALQQVPEITGALVVIDPHTGAVKAMTGGFSYDLSQYNNATQAIRQPGSSFKPFIYLTALQDRRFNYTPVSPVNDIPFEVRTPQGVWRPKNYGRTGPQGPVPMFRALERSLNLAVVNLTDELGIQAIQDTAEAFGIYGRDTQAGAMRRQLAVSLGAQGTTPIQMATAYAMLVNGGRQLRPYFIERVQDRRGQMIWPDNSTYGRRGQIEPFACLDCEDTSWRPDMATPELRDRREPVADDRHTFQIVTMLEGVVKRGTARSISDLPWPVAGKTGTTNDARDAWFVGFTPDLVAAVWIGYKDNRPLGSGATGGSVAAPIFKSFMEAALTHLQAPAAPFRIPPGAPVRRIDPASGNLCAITNPNCVEMIFPSVTASLYSTQDPSLGGGTAGARGRGGFRTPLVTVPGDDFDIEGGDIY